jgi:hypothetical protein
MRFFGYDADLYRGKFRTEEVLFRWVTNSRFFNKDRCLEYAEGYEDPLQCYGRFLQFVRTKAVSRSQETKTPLARQALRQQAIIHFKKHTEFESIMKATGLQAHEEAIMRMVEDRLKPDFPLRAEELHRWTAFVDGNWHFPECAQLPTECHWSQSGYFGPFMHLGSQVSKLKINQFIGFVRRKKQQIVDQESARRKIQKNTDSESTLVNTDKCQPKEPRQDMSQLHNSQLDEPGQGKDQLSESETFKTKRQAMFEAERRPEPSSIELDKSPFYLAVADMPVPQESLFDESEAHEPQEYGPQLLEPQKDRSRQDHAQGGYAEGAYDPNDSALGDSTPDDSGIGESASDNSATDNSALDDSAPEDSDSYHSALDVSEAVENGNRPDGNDQEGYGALQNNHEDYPEQEHSQEQHPQSGEPQQHDTQLDRPQQGEIQSRPSAK